MSIDNFEEFPAMTQLSKVSKIANREGPSWIANQAVVPGSAFTSGTAARRNSATSASLPGFASSGT